MKVARAMSRRLLTDAKHSYLLYHIPKKMIHMTYDLLSIDVSLFWFAALLINALVMKRGRVCAECERKVSQFVGRSVCTFPRQTPKSIK